MAGNKMCVIGINAAGITSKMDSFDKMLFDRSPSIWMMQETKRRSSDAKILSNNLKNYQVYELQRGRSKEEGGKGAHGGGLAMGALHDLKPVLIRQGDDDVECMSIEVSTSTTRIRCVTGYGPQESDCVSRKEKFWDFLDKEVQSAKHDKTGIIIEIDSNAWAGDGLIPNDPNNQNNNGKLLQMFLNRNKNLTLVNSLPLCEGLITRKRKTLCLNEKSILDLFIVCDQIIPHVVKMHVDERGENQLTNFSGINHKGKITETDHSKVELEIDLKFEVRKPVRTETYNYRNTYNKEVFKDITSNTNRISACFNSKEPFQKQI